MELAFLHLQANRLPLDVFVAAARSHLGVNRGEARRLHAALPLDLHVDCERPEVAAFALGGTADAPRVRTSDRCGAHPRFAVTEWCTSCQTANSCPLCLVTPPGNCARCTSRSRGRRAFRMARIGLLLAVLGAAAAWRVTSDRKLADWRQPLDVLLVPMPYGDDPRIDSFAATLDRNALAAWPAFHGREGRRHGLEGGPVLRLTVAPLVRSLPPAPPAADTPWWGIARWSLELRWWAFSLKQRYALPPSDVTLYLLLHPPKERPELDASLGVREARIGIVHTEATVAALPWTELALEHELLHVLGAADSYDEVGQPRFPEGYADPKLGRGTRQPFCEVMAGTIPEAEGPARPARGIDACRVGTVTARAIGWIR